MPTIDFVAEEAPAIDFKPDEASAGIDFKPEDLEAPYAGLTPEERQRKIYGDYLRRRKEDIELGGSPSAGALLPEAMREQGAAARAAIRPFMRPPPNVKPAKPGSVREGLEEAATSLLAAPFDPTVGVPMALTAVAPEVMLPYWGYQGFKDVPEAVAQTVEGETPSEKVQGAARALMDVGMLSAPFKMLRPPPLEPTRAEIVEGNRIDELARAGMRPSPILPRATAEVLKTKPAIDVQAEVTPVSESTLDRLEQEGKPNETPQKTQVAGATPEVAAAPVEDAGQVRAPEPQGQPTGEAEISATKPDAGSFVQEMVPDRESKIARLNELKTQIAPLAQKGGLTSDEARLFRSLNAEANSIRFDLQRPLDISKIPSIEERQSTLPTEIVLTARNDLMRSKKVYTPIIEAAIGVSHDAETPVDIVMQGKDPSLSAQELYNAFNETRNALRQHFGETLKLFRATGRQRQKPTQNWATTKEYAKQFGPNVISKEVPVEDVIAVNVGPSGKYHEIIVGKKPVETTEPPTKGTTSEKEKGQEKEVLNEPSTAAAPTTDQPPPALTPAKASQEFDRLILEHGPELGWVSNPDALYAQIGKAGDTVSIKAKILQSKAMKALRRRVASELGVQASDVDTPAGRAKLLDALKQQLEARTQSDVLEAPEGATGEFILEEKGALPKLRQMENQGDLLATQQEPFALVGEKAQDLARVQREKEAAAKASAEAKAAQAKQQPTLPGTEAGAQALGIAPGATAFHAVSQKLQSIRAKLVNSWATRGNKADIARLKDAADNQARIDANQEGKSVLLEARKSFGGQARQALQAVIPVIESGGDRTKLAQFITQSTGKHLEATRAAQFADANWDALQPLAQKIKAIHDAQITEENANGISTTYRENYIKHAFDVEKLPNRGAEFFGSGGAGGKSGFKAARTFETIYDAIEAGYGKAIKSLDADKLTESRLASGQQLVNDRQWINGFRSITDPTTSKPLISDVTFDRNHFPIAPAGYDVVTVLPGQFVAVHNGYGKIFSAVTGASKIAEAEIAGLPAGQAVLQAAAGIKHGLLLFDTFHASRIMQKQFFLTGKVGWNKGRSLLEYKDADLNEAVRQGEITQEMADYAKANRPTAELLLKQGLNVGRIQEALRNEVVRNIPVIGTFNKWVFDKVTRGAMMESALIEFERTQANNPAMSAEQVAAKVAKDINVTFGNIGRQGLFKSRTLQDLSRILALAPQWVESMARSEIGGFRDLGKVPVDLALGKGLQVGTLGKTMAGGLAAYVIGTQIINLVTRGQLTFQNEEEGHKLDAWIPDVTGKTPGFFLNPLSVVAELTHDAYRYGFKKDNALDVGKQIAENKASPLMRSVGVLWSGKNYSGEKIDGTWNRVKQAGSALVPAPIPVSGFYSGRPGQAQRQLTASAGIKTEPAPSAVKQIGDKARAFIKDKGKPTEVDLVYHADSPHNTLRNAIARGDEKAALAAIETLRKTQTDAKIYQSWVQSLRHPFTGSRAMEGKFKQSLTPAELKLYEAAVKEKQATFANFQSLWAKREPR